MHDARWALLVAVFGGLSFGLVAKVAGRPASREGSDSTGAKARALPKDVYPDRSAAFRLLKREELDENGKKAFDFLITRGGTQFTAEHGIRTFCAEEKTPKSQLKPCIHGTWNMQLYSPRIVEAAYELRRRLGEETTWGQIWKKWRSWWRPAR